MKTEGEVKVETKKEKNIIYNIIEDNTLSQTDTKASKNKKSLPKAIAPQISKDIQELK